MIKYFHYTIKELLDEIPQKKVKIIFLWKKKGRRKNYGTHKTKKGSKLNQRITIFLHMTSSVAVFSVIAGRDGSMTLEWRWLLLPRSRLLVLKGFHVILLLSVLLRPLVLPLPDKFKWKKSAARLRRPVNVRSRLRPPFINTKKWGNYVNEEKMIKINKIPLDEDLASVRYLTWLSRLLSRLLPGCRMPILWIRSQLLLLAKCGPPPLPPRPLRLLDRWLAADDTPELELVVEVGDTPPRPGKVLAIVFIIDLDGWDGFSTGWMSLSVRSLRDDLINATTSSWVDHLTSTSPIPIITSPSLTPANYFNKKIQNY